MNSIRFHESLLSKAEALHKITFFDRLRVWLLEDQFEGQSLEPLLGGLVPDFIDDFVKSDELLAVIVQWRILDKTAGIDDQVFGNTSAAA